MPKAKDKAAQAELVGADEQAAPDDGSPPPADDATPPPTSVRARVLVQCRHGRPDDLVTLPADEAAEGVAAGDLDADPSAVAYAELLAAGA